jgi:hypothetical protein
VHNDGRCYLEHALAPRCHAHSPSKLLRFLERGERSEEDVGGWLVREERGKLGC